MITVFVTFSNTETIFDTLKIIFYLKTVSSKFTEKLPQLSKSDIEFTINENQNLLYEGKLTGYYGSPNSLSIEVRVKLSEKEDTFGDLLKLRGKTCRLDMKYIAYSEVSRPASKKLAAKCMKIIESVGRDVGYSKDEMLKVVATDYFNDTNIEKFNIFDMEEKDAEYFHEYLIYKFQNKEYGGFNLNVSESRTTRAIRDKKCVLCNKSMVGTMHIYPLCKVHLEHYTKIKKSYPSGWIGIFKKDNHFE